MKKILVLSILPFLLTATITRAQKEKVLKKALELKIPREGGANAANVAWHPVLKKYYAVMAGNQDFFIGAFNTDGKLTTPADQKALFDVRGLWYNPFTKTLQMNGYNEGGWAEYKLNAQGAPVSMTILFKGMNQPDAQSVGAFNPVDKVVYFFNEDGNIDVYDLNTARSKETIELTLGKTKEDAEDAGSEDNYDVIDDYNSTTVIYTGLAGAEIGLLNFIENQIELYNKKDGHLTMKLSLPVDAPATEFLNFAYGNGIYWLFDNKARIWMGYK
jgi:hypothetical protein